MNSIYKIKKGEAEILVIDFSDAKEDTMIKTLLEARTLLIREQKQQKVLGILNSKNYITPNFMKTFRNEKREAILFMERQAVVGLSEPKKWILKGYNLVFNRDIRSFDTIEQAVDYLAGESKN
ncbi:MAG: hypothetical protein L0Y35_03195 [Flammeovirgaceae bacterium]|nr:hypothetical protein [Flammeovirgaceae bacterium]